MAVVKGDVEHARFIVKNAFEAVEILIGTNGRRIDFAAEKDGRQAKITGARMNIAARIRLRCALAFSRSASASLQLI